MKKDTKSALTMLIFFILFIAGGFFIVKDRIDIEKEMEEDRRITALCERVAGCVNGLNRHWKKNTKASTVISEINDCAGTNEWQKYMPRVIEKINKEFEN